MSTDSVSFRVIENAPSIIQTIYPDFKKDYMSEELSTKEIREKYDLSKKCYSKLINLVYDETGFKRSGGNGRPKIVKTRYKGRIRTLPEFIHIRENKTGSKTYYLQKRVDNKMQYFGTYNTLEEAEHAKKLFMICDWDKNYLDKIRTLVKK